MDSRLKALVEAAAGAPPIAKPKKKEWVRGIQKSDESAFLKQVFNDVQAMVKKDKEAEIRGSKQKGMEYNNTCVLFSLIALERYLHTKFDIRFALRNFDNGINGGVLEDILGRTTLRYQTYHALDGDPLKKEDVTTILTRSSNEMNSGVIILRYNQNGTPLNHLVAFYPSIVDDDTTGIRIIDCRGDISETLLFPEVDVMEIIECLDAPAVIPKQLRGGRKKTKKNRTKRRKTYGRRV